MKIPNINLRYMQIKNEMIDKAQALIDKSGLDGDIEAQSIARSSNLLKKKRNFSEYKDVAILLLAKYDPLQAYFIMTNINEQFANSLGYPPIGQIMLAIEHIDELYDRPSNTKLKFGGNTWIKNLC